jgi:hypothetical protein
LNWISYAHTDIVRLKLFIKLNYRIFIYWRGKITFEKKGINRKLIETQNTLAYIWRKHQAKTKLNKTKQENFFVKKKTKQGKQVIVEFFNFVLAMLQ